MLIEGLSPALVWGLLPRCVGVLYVIAFGAIIPQHHIMPGSRDLLPLREQLARVRRDYPGPAKYFLFPTLLWLNSSDLAVRGIPYLGVLCGIGAIYGGPWTVVWLLLGYASWISIESRQLYFPWDTLLQEAGFLVLFVPSPLPLPSVHASALPLPDVAFMFRWFVLRVMMGFAKDKFLGATASDIMYLRGFMVWMPLPSPLGWLGHHAPRWLLRVSLYLMFYIEVIAPFLGFFTGPLRVVCFISLTALMVGIAVTGNWGFFNYGYAMLCICLLDVHASVFDLFSEPWRDRWFSAPDLAVHVIMLALFLMSIFYVLFDSWLSRAWLSWPKDLFAVPHRWQKRVERIHRALAPLRWLASLRMVNAYGVFPPNSMPPLRLQPVLEGSQDGVHFSQYGFKHVPSLPNSKLGFIAPYHARLDQWSYYVGQGIDGYSLFGGFFPGGNPYWAGMRINFMEVIAQRIMRHDRTMLAGLGHNPFPDKPPRYMRIGMIALAATSMAERAATGNLWRIRRLGTYAPVRCLDSELTSLLLPEPELFMPEFVDFKRRSWPLRTIAAALQAGMPADQAVLQASDLTPADVEQFWNEVVPLLAEGRGDWTQIHRYGATLAQRYSIYDIHRFERLLERFAWLLQQRTERYHWGGEAEPQLPPRTCYRFHKLLHEMVLDGRDEYLAMLEEPARIVARAEHCSLETELWAFGLLRYDQLMAFALVFRSAPLAVMAHEGGAPGLFEYYNVLAKIVPSGEEFLLRPEKHADGEHTVAEFYPPKWPKPELSSQPPGRRSSTSIG